MLEETRVLEVIFDKERAVGVKIQKKDGALEEVRAEVIVDASGQSTMLQNRLKLRVWDPVLNKGAVWTYWEGAYRDTGKDEGATIVIQTPNKKGWWWYIPLHNNIVSLGVVGQLFLNTCLKAAAATSRFTMKRLPCVRPCSNESSMPKDTLAILPPRITRIAQSNTPATAGCWWVMRSDSSILCILPACCWRSSRDNWRPTRSAKDWRRATPRPR